jgi:bacterioferritin
MCAVAIYKELLTEVADASIMLEEYARGQIGMEEQHALEIKKMLRDFSE